MSDHVPTFVIRKKAKMRYEKADFYGRSDRNYNRDKLQTDLQSMDWAEFFQQEDINKAWQIIIERITKVADGMCPLKTI